MKIQVCESGCEKIEILAVCWIRCCLLVTESVILMFNAVKRLLISCDHFRMHSSSPSRHIKIVTGVY